VITVKHEKFASMKFSQCSQSRSIAKLTCREVMLLTTV
jgi:hypothetical protein